METELDFLSGALRIKTEKLYKASEIILAQIPQHNKIWIRYIDSRIGNDVVTFVHDIRLHTSTGRTGSTTSAIGKGKLEQRRVKNITGYPTNGTKIHSLWWMVNVRYEHEPLMLLEGLHPFLVLTPHQIYFMLYISMRCQASIFHIEFELE
ncbi:hypothetical protein BDQ12DRAFT_670452 [Crucibulum laeve]|uniref:Uncharacterized protein n=1 Tax=Crucibulum laeve TaxID=68775 RepID=A0A5C3LJ73_9AGAR|nr:hypothetical protein BDQ12DRAFT_670452 [Crucibulum laeve]